MSSLYTIKLYRDIKLGTKNEKGLKTDESKLNLLYYYHRISVRNYHKEEVKK